jgi:Ser/Thr protein kinase RdoA (MazF antagonist)
MRPDPAQLVAWWDGSPQTLTHVRHGANAVYTFRAGNRRLILRVTEDRHRNRCQLEAELDFIRFVAARGVAAALPISSNRDACVETVQLEDGVLWHAVAFMAVPGRHFRFFSPDIDRPLFRAWGSAMAALHAASRDFVPAAPRRRLTWAEQDTTSCDHTRLPSGEAGARREHARVAEWLASLHATAESWGLIHGDFERTNFVLNGSTLRLYDFDDACYHWYLADVAHALWAFRGAPASDRARFLEWFLEGYRERCAVEVDVRERLSWFVRLRTLSLFIHQLHASRGSATDGSWERRVRAGFDEPFRW